jgi:hypothetical protein
MIEKIKALIQWFVILERQTHHHWCTMPKGFDDGSCEHMTSAWYCKGIWCANVESKDCPACVKKQVFLRRVRKQLLLRHDD